MIFLLATDWENVKHWLKTSGTNILIILVVLFVAYAVFKAVFPRVARAAMLRGAHPPDGEMDRRADTIIGVVDGVARVAVVILAVITILPEFGINITAIVTGLGIGGLALALGSQQLVRDGVNGIFLLAEDQYRDGDVVTIAGQTGTVEAITLRRTVIRDGDGVVHSVPNGSIGVVSNHTRDYAQVNVEVKVTFGEDVSKVTKAVAEVAAGMRADTKLSELMLDDPRVAGVSGVSDGAITLTVTARTRPTARAEIASELWERLAAAFVKANVRVPYPTAAAPSASAGSD